jgi:hypothetical protein
MTPTMSLRTPRSSVQFTILLLALLLPVALIRAEADYAIQLSRPAVVGERYHVTTMATDEQTVALRVNAHDVPVRSDNSSIELVASNEVLEVSARGKERKSRIVIEKFTRTAAGKTTELLPAGATVIAERAGDKMHYFLGELPAIPAVSRALELSGVVLENDQGASDDGVFGTQERKKIGDTWPVDGGAAALSLAKRGIQVDPAKVSGTVRLTELSEQPGGPALRIAASFRMGSLLVPPMPGMAIDDSDMTATMSGLLPVDVTKRRLEEKITMAMIVSASGTKDGNTMETTMTKKTTRETKFTRN